MSEELFSYRLASYRKRNGFTQTDLGQALGVSQRHIASLESGQKEADPNSSLAKLFGLMESGQVKMSDRNSVHEEPTIYRADKSPVSRPHGLGIQDALAQVRSDISMMEGGSLEDKRRAYHFLRDIHLPLLARCLKIE
jgi:transcriptional regulator with XRE-family HTH domain